MAVASGARFYFISVLGERVLTDLRRAVFDHLLTLDATFFDTHRVGELTSRLNGDVATIRGAIGSSLSMVLRGARHHHRRRGADVPHQPVSGARGGRSSRRR